MVARLMLVISLALSLVASARPPGPRERILRWEAIHKNPGSQEAADALYLQAKSAPTRAEERLLLERLAREYPQTLIGMNADLDLAYHGSPETFLRKVEELIRRAGGPPTMEAALERCQPYPLAGLDPQHLDFIAHLYGLLSQAADQTQARRIDRFRRIQYGEPYRVLQLLPDHPGPDQKPPRVEASCPLPNTPHLTDASICFQLHDGGPDESQILLDTVRFRLDGVDLTGRLERRHSINLFPVPDAIAERIEYTYRPRQSLAAGPHRIEVEAMDQSANPTAVSWVIVTFGKAANDEFYQLLVKGPEQAALDYLEQHPRAAFEVLPLGGNRTNTPLREAVGRRRNQVVSRLLECGTARDDGSLYVAAINGNLEAVKLLVAAGAAREKEASRSLLGAAGSNHPDIVKLLLGQGVTFVSGPELDQLFEGCARNGSAEMLSLLLPYFDVNTRLTDGGTVLHLAAASGQVDAVKVLLKAGCDPSMRDNEDRTPLDRAGDEKAPAALRELLEVNSATPGP